MGNCCQPKYPIELLERIEMEMKGIEQSGRIVKISKIVKRISRDVWALHKEEFIRLGKRYQYDYFYSHNKKMLKLTYILQGQKTKIMELEINNETSYYWV